jgi:carbamoyl-phosphate synthase large subunit
MKTLSLKNKIIFFTVANNSGSAYYIREFKRIGMKVYVGDVNSESIGFHLADKFFQLPPQDDEGYVNHLLSLVEKEKVDFLVPAGEGECLKVAKLKDKFNQVNCLPIVTNVQTLEASIDKADLYGFFSENNLIPMMKYHVVNTIEDFEVGLKKLKGFSLCVKPATGSGSRGFAFLDEKPIAAEEFFCSKMQFLKFSLEQFRNMLSVEGATPKFLLMEVLGGTHYDSNMICKEGKIIFQSIRTREAAALGTITQATVVSVPEIEDINVKIAKALNTDGYVNTQYIGNKLIEINPRWSTSLNWEDINEYLMSVKLSLGLDVAVDENASINYLGTKMLRYWDVFVFKNNDM